MRITIHWQSVVAGTVLAAGLIGFFARPASADRPYNLRSFSGTYKIAALEIRQDPAGTGPIEYCDISGTFTPDGAGNGVSDVWRRCSIEGLVHDVENFVYTVSPDGVASSTSLTSGDTAQWQLVDGGKSGIHSAALDSDPRILVRHGVGARP